MWHTWDVIRITRLQLSDTFCCGDFVVPVVGDLCKPDIPADSPLRALDVTCPRPIGRSHRVCESSRSVQVRYWALIISVILVCSSR